MTAQHRASLTAFFAVMLVCSALLFNKVRADPAFLSHPALAVERLVSGQSLSHNQVASSPLLPGLEITTAPAESGSVVGVQAVTGSRPVTAAPGARSLHHAAAAAAAAPAPDAPELLPEVGHALGGTPGTAASVLGNTLDATTSALGAVTTGLTAGLTGVTTGLTGVTTGLTGATTGLSGATTGPASGLTGLGTGLTSGASAVAPAAPAPSAPSLPAWPGPGAAKSATSVAAMSHPGSAPAAATGVAAHPAYPGSRPPTHAPTAPSRPTGHVPFGTPYPGLHHGAAPYGAHLGVPVHGARGWKSFGFHVPTLHTTWKGAHPVAMPKHRVKKHAKKHAKRHAAKGKHAHHRR